MPFIARYRKKITGMLDGIQLRRLEKHLHALCEFEKRRLAAILLTEQQNRMTLLLLEVTKYAKNRAQLG